MKKAILVAGARPNFVKIAPMLRAMEKSTKIKPVLVHTGQHYDKNMSDSFFKELEIRQPDHHLGAGPGSHAQQTASIMTKFEEICLAEKPDVVVVVGDVNSTIAAGLVAKKLQLQLAHVEAGLRSRDRMMPEEINRLATDAIADMLFTTEEEANTNLMAEGHSPESVHFVGHVMIDTLLFEVGKFGRMPPTTEAVRLKQMAGTSYVCLTMHRPSNVDNLQTLISLVETIEEVGRTVAVIFPCHPRTRGNIDKAGLRSRFKEVPAGQSPLAPGVYLLDPMSYRDFLYLWKDATLVLTDSGGLQEETTALGVPCITMRENTERPVTATIGTNEVVGTDRTKILDLSRKALAGSWKKGAVPPLWDGKASERIVAALEKHLG